MPYLLPLARLLARTGAAALLPRLRRLLGGGVRYLRHYSDHLLTAPLSDLRQAAACLEPVGAEVIDLGQGAPQFDLLPTSGAKLPADRRGWPPFGGLPELRAAVADQLREDAGRGFHPFDEILITAGASGAIHVALDAFLSPGDRVLLFDPTSPLYPIAVKARRGRVRWLPSWGEDGRTRFPLARLAALLRGVRLIVVNSPANPTGGVVSLDDLEQIAWWADRRDVLILSDEAFARFRYEGRSGGIAALPRARRRTLTVGGMSQGYALAAARVGWLAADRDLLRPCRAAAALREPFVPTLCQLQALAALRAGRVAFAPIRAAFASRRRYVCDRLRALELNVPWPAGAFFVWVPVWPLGISGREFAARLLDEFAVRVVPGDLFGPSGAGYVRLSYVAEEARLQEGLNRLAAFVRGGAQAAPTGLRQAA